MIPRHKRMDFAAYVGLAASVIYIWCREYRVGSEQKITAPIEYWGDALAVQGTIRATSEFSYFPFIGKSIARLGAPYVARWDDYPVTEDLIFFFWGMVARVTGVFTAANLAYVTAGVLAAWSMYFVARRLRAQPGVAFMVAMVFGLSHGLFWRNIHHLVLSYYWTAPLFALLGMKLASRSGLRFGTRWFRWALVLAAFGGIGNPYYGNFSLQLVVIGALLGHFGHRRPWRRLLPVAAVIGTQMGCFVLMNMDSIWSRLANGPNTHAFTRSIGHMETYALRPIDLVVPRGLALIADLPKNFAEYDHGINRSEPSYIGIVAAIGLIWLMGDAFYRAAAKQFGRSTQWGLSVVVLIGYAMVAGVNMLFGLSGFVLFRSTNRVSMFIMAIALLFLATRVTSLVAALKKRIPKIPKHAPEMALWIVGLPVAWYGIREQHTPIEHDRITHQRAQAESDGVLGRQLEATLPPMAGVFLLPHTSAPEGDPYPFRLLTHTRHVRFSFGNMEGRPEAEWATKVGAMQPDAMIDALESTGFSAVCILVAGYRPTALFGKLAERGRTEQIRSPNGEWVCNLLKPSGPLQPPK